MANPITWQNIQTPSQGNPAQFMQLAQTGIDGAFDKLQGVLKQRETTDQANWNQIGVNNAEAFKSALYGMTTPDQMAAAQKSGQFNEMLTGYGAQVKDPAALRALMDGRLATLQGQESAGITHGNLVQEAKDAPHVDAAKAFYAQGNVFAGDLEAANVNRNRASLAEYSRDIQRKGVLEGRQDAANTQTVLMRPYEERKAISDLASATATQEYHRAQASALDAAKRKDEGEKSDKAFIKNSVKTAYADFVSQDGAKSAAIGEVTGALKLPRLPTGAPDMQSMSVDQRTLLQNTLRAKRLDVPLSTSAVLDRLEKAAVERGLSPDNIVEMRKSANAVFSSNNGITSAADQADQATYNKVLEARKVEATKNNMFFNPPEEMAAGKAKVMEKITVGIKDGEGTKNPIKQTISKWMDQGLPVVGKDGKTSYVPIPPKLMEYALSSGMETDTWLSNDTSARVEKVLRSSLQAPEYQAQIAEADFLRAGGDEVLKADRDARKRILAGSDTSAQTLADIARGGGLSIPAQGTAAPMTLPSYTAPRTAFGTPPARGIYGRSPAPEKKSPEIAAAEATNGFTPAGTPAPKVSVSEGFALSPITGQTTKGSAPVALPKDVQWQEPKVLVQAKPNTLPSKGGERATVTFVSDGDTASLKRGDGSSLNCRIDKIDAPETSHPKTGKVGQPFGEEAKRTLQQMIENKEVTLRITQPASGKNYGRALCQIDIEGKSVDLEMVKAGAAWMYRRYTSDVLLDQAEKSAKSQRAGLWGQLNPENPETFRHKQR